MTTATATMKARRFGVEIETIGLDRARAAQVIQTVVGGSVVYVGTGYDTWAVVAPDGRKWLAMRDGSLSQVNAAEVVTPICTYSDLETIQAIVRALRTAGARADDSCGIHVHVGAEDLSIQAVKNLANYVHRREELLFAALKVSATRRERYTKPLETAFVERVAAAKPADRAALNPLWYGRNELRPAHYDSSRYHGLNLHSLWFRGTVEFRYFNGTMHAGEIKSYVQLCLGMVAKASESRSVSFVKVHANGAKINAAAMLAEAKWIGLVGDEYKSARYHLTKHLPGFTRERFEGAHAAA